MAKTYNLHEAVETLKDSAVALNSAFENDGELSELASDLRTLIARADTVLTVAVDVDNALGNL